jgi:WD40 repeat protein
VETTERRIFHGTDTDGIGSITVHPSKKWFAVAEKGISPNIYIYAWPSLKLYRILKKGTDLSYAHVEFSSSGKLLASLGGQPDYTLTVWNWQSQKVVLKARANFVEVFRVSFSPYTDDILFTCGASHVMFWKMAQTFTGLKLQGQIAKFGQLELSDTSALYELPDGKVVSGTVYGTLIVWEGQFVKAHLMLNVEDQLPLHGTTEKPATIEVLL